MGVHSQSKPWLCLRPVRLERDGISNRRYGFSTNGRAEAKSKSWGTGLGVQYTNQVAEKYVFKPVSLKLREQFQKENSQLAFLQDDNESDRHGISDRKSKSFSPNVDLYFWRQFRNRNELMLTLGGGYTNSSSNTYRNQYDLLLVDTPVFEDFLNLKEILIG